MNHEAKADKPLPYKEELRNHLAELDALAELQGATDVRNDISSVLHDFDHPAGKDNARIAIGEFRVRLGLDKARGVSYTRSYRPPSPISSANEATA